jgi:hypothetical protein
MDRSKALKAKWQGLAPLLQRRFWQPLRNMMNIFHLLPLTAAVLLFALLASEGQFREIYIAYLEGPNGDPVRWVVGIIAALALFSLVSALLSEAHYSLSTMRINVIYSSYSNPDTNSALRRLQRSAAFCLAMSPWLGFTTGLFGARNFVADRYCQLLAQGLANVPDLPKMQHVLQPGGWAIAGTILFLGASTTAFATVNQQARIAQRVVALVAPPFIALLFLLFTDWLSTDLSKPHALVTIALILFATALYFDVYRRLYKRRTRLIIYTRSQAGTGISVRKLRRHLLMAWGFFPWLLFAGYFVVVPGFVAPAVGGETWSTCPLSAATVPVPGPWAIFPAAMCCTVAVGLLIGLWLNRVSERWLLRRMTTVIAIGVLAAASIALAFLDVDTVVSAYRFIGPLATAALQPLFLITTFALLAWLSQKSGFPALTLVVLAGVVCVTFPNYVGLTALALGIVCVLFGLVAFLSRLYALTLVALILPVLGVINWHQLQGGGIQQNQAVSAQFDPQSVKFQFACWLDQRGVALPAAGNFAARRGNCPAGARSLAQPPAPGAAAAKYPVFIIAAEGGGIYAASAASTFLARLQDAAPHFAQHVFAISGVSGGAIGATVFQALDQATAVRYASTASAANGPSAPSACPQYPNEPAVKADLKSLSEKVRAVMEDDHFSPVVGSIFPELVGSPTGRDAALTASFQDSVAAYDALAGQCLQAPFAAHWSDAATAPALVLNSTWVETGFRVAFAPFHLHDINEALYSFSDQLMPDEECPSVPGKQSCVSLMAAATVSARFPLILPPFSAVLQNANTDPKRWNFVDGGYSDNSGATTALDLYNALQTIAPDSVDLHIVLITSSDPQPNLLGSDINGTVFRDTLAPINALMTVREDLGNEAVARACSQIYPRDAVIQRNQQAQSGSAAGAERGYRSSEENDVCIQHAWEQPAPPLQIVEIQDQTYGLSLGWKISQTSFDVVSWMLGKPSGNCKHAAAAAAATDPAGQQAKSAGSASDQNSQLTSQIVQRNSCVMRTIVDLVEGPPPSPSATPNPTTTAR